MLIVQSAYFKEKEYAYSRLLFVLGVTIVAFLMLIIAGERLHIHDFLLKVLVGVSLFSLLHYMLILKFPNTLVKVRKFTLFFVDIIVLTLGIILIGSSGLFLLPLYILIVMESGVSFGFIYFYFTITISSVSWVFLINSSAYWAEHSDTVAIFAITTFLIPLVYLKQMMRLHQRHEKLHENLETASYDANFDALTGLPNRKQYDAYMKDLLDQKSFFALLFIDLNKFKEINDTYGHDVGDDVLREVSRRLSLSIDEEDMLARLGGDEFVIITKRKKTFLSTFLQELEHRTIGQYTVDDVSVHIGLSIGVSLFPDDCPSETFLRKYADEAMYMAKKRNDTHHVFYEELKSS